MLFFIFINYFFYVSMIKLSLEYFHNNFCFYNFNIMLDFFRKEELDDRKMMQEGYS